MTTRKWGQSVGASVSQEAADYVCQHPDCELQAILWIQTGMTLPIVTLCTGHADWYRTATWGVLRRMTWTPRRRRVFS